MMKILLSATGMPKLRNGRLALAAQAVALGGGTVAATALTLTDIDKDQRPFQRTAGGYYDVTVAGTSDGTASVQARAVDSYTGEIVVDWQNIAAPSGGTFSGKLRCPARIRPCKLEIRDSINTAVTRAGTNRFYVGAHWIWWGQSNMVALPKDAYRFPLGGKGSTEYSGGAFRRSGKILDTYQPNQLSTINGNTLNTYPGTPPAMAGAYIGDALVYFQNVLSEALGCAVCVTVSALGGQALSYWAPGADGWTKLTNLLTEIGGDAEGAVLYQGEGDASNAATTTAGYKALLAARQAQFHTATGRNASTFKFGVISLGPTNAGGGYATRMAEVRAAQVEFANNTAGAFLFGANHDGVTTDGIHIKPVAFSHLGAGGARAAAALYGVGPSGSGPRVVGASRVGAVITLTAQHAGGTALVAGPGGDGSNLKGFRVFLASDTNRTTELPQASTSIPSATTIRVTLASDPGAPVVIDYGMTPAPHSPDPASSQVDPVLGSAVYDNVVLVNQDHGCILQPFAAIAVTGS